MVVLVLALAAAAACQDDEHPPLEEVAARVDRLLVPYRVQTWGTCGLYALGMVMDYYALVDRSNPTALVFASDDRRQASATLPPTAKATLFDTAKSNGYFSEGLRLNGTDGGMYVADDVGRLAEQFGYQARVFENAGLDEIDQALARRHPPIVAFDVGEDGNPTLAGGAHAHYAVIVGRFAYRGEEWVIAQHGHKQGEYLWRAHDLITSMKQVQPALASRVIEIFPKVSGSDASAPDNGTAGMHAVWNEVVHSIDARDADALQSCVTEDSFRMLAEVARSAGEQGTDREVVGRILHLDRAVLPTVSWVDPRVENDPASGATIVTVTERYRAGSQSSTLAFRMIPSANKWPAVVDGRHGCTGSVRFDLVETVRR